MASETGAEEQGKVKSARRQTQSKPRGTDLSFHIREAPQVLCGRGAMEIADSCIEMVFLRRSLGGLLAKLHEDYR